MLTAVFLGITALLTAWATWIGSLHGGNQATNYTRSNNLAAEGNSAYNSAMQLYLSDYMAWNVAKDYYYELEAAKQEGDQAKIDLLNTKIESFKKMNVSDNLLEAVQWMEDNHEDSPFKMPGMTEKYFAVAQENVGQSQELLEEGMRDNTKGDSYNLVTVIYSLTLFLLGIIGTFKDMPNRITVLLIAVGFLIFAFIYMCTIPLPTGFSKMNFFDFNG